MAPGRYDIIIAGGGPVGLSAALAAKATLGRGVRILLCAPGGNSDDSLRTYAISPSSRHMLEKLGVWQKLNDVQPILKMQITDSALHDALRQTLLEFETGREASAALAYMVTGRDLVSALETAAQQAGVEFLNQSIAGLTRAANSIGVETPAGDVLTAGLLIGCDGATSRIRDMAKIPVIGWHYDRDAIVTTLLAQRDHNGTAVQHFLPAGTFALLPLTGRRFSIVWVEKPQDAARLCALPPDDFNREVQFRAGNMFGELKRLEPPVRFPLRLQVARRVAAQRLVLLGDAARTMHPLAGQGLNLGLRDVAFLMDTLNAQSRLGLDIGSLDSLNSFDRSRSFDTVKMLAATDALFHIFTSAAMPIRVMRDITLNLTNNLSGLKTSLIRQASGGSSGTPQLMQP